MEHVSVKERLHNMSFKEKCDYIWEYYKIHILSTIILIAIIISTVHSIATKVDVYCNITYIGDYISDETLSQFKSDINEIVLKGDETKTIEFNTFLGDEESLKSNPQIVQKLAVMIPAKEIDLAIVNKDYFDTNFSSDMFLDLTTLDGFSSIPLSNYELIKNTNDPSDSGIYGIKTKNINLINKLNSDNADNILVLISNSDRKNEALTLLKSILS